MDESNTDQEAYVSRQYEAPLGEVEESLALVWRELLRVERVGRHDNFFELGGDSLVIAQMMERLRRMELSADERSFFQSRSLAELASVLTGEGGEVGPLDAPPNLIPPGCEAITPQMLSLVELEPAQIAHIVRAVPGGIANIQDIYPLTPLQEGILFHRLLNERVDLYVLTTLFELNSRAAIGPLAEAIGHVVQRHDVLRAAVLWQGLPHPVQVVCRSATLMIEEILLSSDRDRAEQLNELMRPGQVTLDLAHAPIGRLLVAKSPKETTCYALLQLHHLICDHQSLQTIVSEVLECLEGRARELPVPGSYRDYVSEALRQARLDDAESFFRSKLGDLEEPSAPFGLTNVHVDGTEIEESRRVMPAADAHAIRAQIKRAGVSPARLFHAAWAVLVGHTSNREEVVFGTIVRARRGHGGNLTSLVGMSVNTLPLRLRLADLSARDLLEHTHQELVELLKHQHAPLTLAQRCSGVAAGIPLFTTLLNYRRAVPEHDLNGAREAAVRVRARGEAWSNYPFAMTVDDTAEEFVFTAQAHKSIGPDRLITYLIIAVQELARALEQAPHTPALSLSIIPPDERKKILERFNATDSPFPQEKRITDLFEVQVQRTPHATALVCGDYELTYAALNQRANQLAQALRARGVEPERRVAVYLERSVDFIVGLLGILKAGGAYVPIDTGYPAERVTHILRDSSPLAILTKKRLAAALEEHASRAILLDDEAELGHWSGENLDSAAMGFGSRDLAYVIYTSGSTGAPKGVMVEHRSFTNLLHWHCTAFALRASDRCSCVAAVGFDGATWEIWPPLIVGATLVMSAQAVARDTGKLLEWWARETLHVSFLPTPLAEFAFNRGLASRGLRTLLVGGDRLRSRPLGLPFTLINNYGPTESTVVATSGTIDDADPVLHIGRPIANTSIYILDRRQNLVPLGVAGELHIGGACVARGYLDRPELTRERFLPDPFRAEPGARMYRSGDLARWRADGTVEYLGRNDTQIKIRGFRIEPAEIEIQLARHDGVKEVAVVAREEVAGEKRLVAYFVPQSPGAPTPQELRRHLKALLPAYMVPSAFVMLEQLPLSPNGKLDRRSLPAPGPEANVVHAFAPPEGELEELLAAIWEDLLGATRIGREDNFFELGGHSLLAVEMMERLRRFSLATEVRHVFETATLAELASLLIEDARTPFEVPPNRIPPECRALTPDMLPLVKLEPHHIDRIASAVPGGVANIQDIYPLAPLQAGILFHHLLDEGGSDTYVLSIVLKVCSRSRVDELALALQGVIDRHDILRSAFLWEDLPQPVQVVHRRAHLPVSETHLSDHLEPIVQIQEWIRPDLQRLDLREAPLMRLQVAPDPATAEWYVLLQFHHLICDHVTLEVLISEVTGSLEGRGSALPQPLPYRNHVAQALAYATTHDSDAFFRGKLAEIDEPTAPFGLLDVHGDGSQVKEASVRLDCALGQRVRGQARHAGVSPATLFHVAWALVVAHTSGREDVVFGTVLLGRLHVPAGGQRTLGMFINTLPLRIRLGQASASELLAHTQRELIELLMHEQGSLAAAQRCSGVNQGPLFSSLLNYRHSVPRPETQWSGAKGIELLAFKERTNYPITVSIDDLGEAFSITAQTDRRLNPARIVQYLSTALASLLGALEQDVRIPPLALPILPEAERRTVIEAFNERMAPYPQHALIHELFEAQAARTPNAIAVECDGKSFTYVDLNRRANQLARYLRDERAGPGRLVGVCLERSLEMVVALVGILKAGSAYLPLDPNYPAGRLQYMLQDAAPALVLTNDRMRKVLPQCAACVISLDAKLHELGSGVDDKHSASELKLTSQSLVYVIYTSGSTGQPKGTAMPHESMVNLIEWHRRELSADRVRVLHFAALSFDVAFQEIFSTLCTGGTLVLPSEEVRRDPSALLEFLTTHAVERLFVPPVMLQGLAEYARGAPTAPARLRDIITAGEQLRISPEIVELFGKLGGCRLNNHYGPTETHVVTALTLTGDPAQWPVLPSIGRPISNTQMYVLDRSMQPVPIGVSGEIYIGGAGVARGYLHRGDLTVQRFVADPFASEVESRLYKTGDVGRWQPDGTLVYLGRNDQQIKIRGFRVELGEIEAQLTRHERVKEAVVSAYGDQAGSKRLIAYVTLRDSLPLSSQELREHLKALVPEHMVPSAFLVIDRLPLTPSGKINCRALPPPQAAPDALQEREPPRGHIEQRLSQIWQAELQVDQIGRGDNLFDLGAHSLMVLSAVLQINEAFDAELRVTEVYKNPTIADLAARIGGLASQDERIELSREAIVSATVQKPAGSVSVIPEAILLTGATGFVGRFLLAQLLSQTSARIYCLVRAPTAERARLRLRATLSNWGLWSDECGGRVIALPGNLRQPRLGLDEATFQMLAHTVDSLYHCGASMNHLETYAMAKAANVDAAQDLLALACGHKPKVLNYISTLGVFSPTTTSAPRTVSEQTPIEDERHWNSRGYTASKWVAEGIFMLAAERGIACNIFRIGLVWADQEHGRYDELQHVYRHLKSCLLTGYGIRDYHYEMPPTPVDYVARAVTHLANRHHEGLNVFHISSTTQLTEGLFESLNAVLGTGLVLLPAEEWLEKIQQLHGEGQTLPLGPLLELHAQQRTTSCAHIRFDCTRTYDELATARILVPDFNDLLLKRCVEDMVSRDEKLRAVLRARSAKAR